MASWMSFFMMVTRLAWMAQRLVSSKSPTMCASEASCRARRACDWNRISPARSSPEENFLWWNNVPLWWKNIPTTRHERRPHQVYPPQNLKAAPGQISKLLPGVLRKERRREKYHQEKMKINTLLKEVPERQAEENLPGSPAVRV